MCHCSAVNSKHRWHQARIIIQLNSHCYIPRVSNRIHRLDVFDFQTDVNDADRTLQTVSRVWLCYCASKESRKKGLNFDEQLRFLDLKLFIT